MSRVGRLIAAPFGQRARQEYLYLVVTLAPAIPVFLLSLVGVAATVLTLVGIGVPVLLAVLMLAGQAQRMFRPPARTLMGWRWHDHRRHRVDGSLRRALAVLSDATRWRALLYGITKLPLTLIGVYLSTVALVMGTLAVTFPAWWFVSHDGFGFLDARPWIDTWIFAMQGAAVLLAFPWLLRLVVAVDRSLVFALLAPNPDRERVLLLQSSRTALTTANEASLRRLERDLHDGTQARLLTVGMMLARLEHRVGDAANAAMVSAAKQAVADTLDELREIIRGLHPPALNSGLDIALTTLAARCPLPVELTYSLHAPPAESIATAVYFAASELLANATRHSGAIAANVEVRCTGNDIVLKVNDNGHGGAQVSTTGGSGLAGLRDRTEALDGHLSIVSPLGGPTAITVTLPVG
jgi:signal transduction histidine kinase